MAWNAAAHPRAAAGSAAGGQFTIGGSSSKSRQQAVPSAAEAKRLQKRARSGARLTAHQQHELHAFHLAHVQHMAAMPKAAQKTAARRAKRPGVKRIGM